MIHGRGFTIDDETSVFLGETEIQDIEVLSGGHIAAEFPPISKGDEFTVQVRNRYGAARLLRAFRAVDGLTFLRGDADYNGVLTIVDPIRTLTALVGSPPFLCRDASAADDDGKVSIKDAVYTLSYLFRGGPAPLPPFPTPDTDPTPDDLACCPFQESL